MKKKELLFIIIFIGSIILTLGCQLLYKKLGLDNYYFLLPLSFIFLGVSIMVGILIINNERDKEKKKKK